MRQARAAILARGQRVAFFLFGAAEIGFGLALLLHQILALAPGCVDLCVELVDAALQALHARMFCARLFHQGRDLCEHGFARRSRPLRILIQHSQPCLGGVAFGR